MLEQWVKTRKKDLPKGHIPSPFFHSFSSFHYSSIPIFRVRDHAARRCVRRTHPPSNFSHSPKIFVQKQSSSFSSFLYSNFPVCFVLIIPSFQYSSVPISFVLVDSSIISLPILFPQRRFENLSIRIPGKLVNHVDRLWFLETRDVVTAMSDDLLL